MLVEAFPRLAIRLRSTFPEADIRVRSNRNQMTVTFPAFPNWELEVNSYPCHDQFQVIQTSIVLQYDCLEDIRDDDFNRLISAENLGLRGASITVDPTRGPRTLRLRSSFIAQKGRTRDEAENLAIDLLSLLRFARLFEDRVLRSTAGNDFSYEMYFSQYFSKSIGRSRFINYARTVFQGSTERVFGQVASMLREDHNYKVLSGRAFVATLVPPDAGIEIHLRIPEEIPMLTCSATMRTSAYDSPRSFALVKELNTRLQDGHFEVNADGSLISFVTWKHLTNDLRYYSLDHLVRSVAVAQQMIDSATADWTSTTSAEERRARASSLNAYVVAA